MSQSSRSRQLDLLRRWIANHIDPDPSNNLLRSHAFTMYQRDVGPDHVDEAAFHRVLRNTFNNILHTGKGLTYAYCGLRIGNNDVPRNEDLGAVLAALKQSTPTLRRVPRGARIQVARALALVLNDCVNANDVDSWRKLFLLPYRVLRVPQKAEKVTNLTTFIKGLAAISIDSKGDLPELPSNTSSPDFKKTASDVAFAKKIEAKLADGDVSGAIRLAVSEDTIAPNCQETLSSLKSKHPEHPHPINYPDCPERFDKLEYESHHVFTAINSFPAGSAGGLDSLRPQLLKDLLTAQQGEVGERLLSAITSFCNKTVSGLIPPEIKPILFGASLTALIKKCGGIRPVAVGNVWRRIPSKLVATTMQEKLVPILQPHQLGVGVRNGAEIGAHAARTFYQQEHPTPKLFVKLDFRNAFNELRRDSMLTSIANHFPETFPYFSAAYSEPSFLYYGASMILSQCGIQQGDPAGPAVYALTTQPLVDAMNTDLNVWYLDDGTLGGEPEDVLTCIKTVQLMGCERGLHLNVSKCEFAVIGGEISDRERISQKVKSVHPSMLVIEETTATLLGAPLSFQASQAVLEKKTSVLQRLGDRLKHVSSHSALYLLRVSMSIPRLIYFLRTAPLWNNVTSLRNYDELLKLTLECILNCRLSDCSWVQASLPIRNGGIGIRCASDIAFSCFLASMYAALPSLQTLYPAGEEDYLAIIQTAEARWSGGGVFPLPDETSRNQQACWDEPVVSRIQDQLLVGAEDPRSKARLQAVSQPKTGAWLQAIPSPQLGTHLNNESVRVATALRLGVPTCFPHTCPCGSDVDELGTHGLYCKISAGRRSRHTALNDIVGRALRTAEVPVLLEPTGVSRQDGKHPDGLTLIPWERGRELLWDVTVRDTLAPSYLLISSTTPGGVARQAESDKLRKYRDLTDHYIFIPVAFETLGVWGPQALAFIKKIGTRVANITGEKRSVEFLTQRISVALQKGNAASVLGTLPNGKKLEEIFLL